MDSLKVEAKNGSSTDSRVTRLVTERLSDYRQSGRTVERGKEWYKQGSPNGVTTSTRSLGVLIIDRVLLKTEMAPLLSSRSTAAICR